MDLNDHSDLDNLRLYKDLEEEPKGNIRTIPL